jgi:anthranilate phosphoribosyltransferase
MQSEVAREIKCEPRDAVSTFEILRAIRPPPARGPPYCGDLGGLIRFAIEHIGQYPMNPVDTMRCLQSAKPFAHSALLCNTSSMSLVKDLLRPLAEDGAALTRDQAAGVLEEILAGDVPDVETAALLAVMATRGEQAPELAGFVDVMRRNAVALPFSEEERAELVDCVGTGGGGPQTFNISCGAALVAAAAGAKVAKHGNRAVTSRCGAADVLEALGVPIELSPEQAVECLRETGFVFLFAPLYHPAMKTLGQLRRALGFRTIFNLVGPLTNPGHARNQVIGVLAPSRVLLVGRTLVALGAKRAFVVHGTDGIDELTTTGESVVARVEESESGQSEMKAARITPEMAGLPRTTLDQFVGGDMNTNKALLYDVLTGIQGARRNIVLLNAAATLVAAGIANDLKEGVAMGAEAIDSGEAAATLAKLRQFGAKHAVKQ